VIRVRRYHADRTCDEDVVPTAISDLVGAADELVWVDVVDASEDEVAMLVDEFEVHRLAAEDLLQRRQRPRLEQYPTHALLTAKDCTASGTTGITIDSLDVLFGDGWVITLHSNDGDATPPLDSEEIHRRFQKQRGDDGGTDEGFFLAVLLDLLVDRYFDVIDTVEDRFEALEEAVFAVDRNGDDDVQRQLFLHREALIAFRKAVSPLREALASLVRREIETFTPVSVLHLRDVHDNLVRLVEIIEGQRELLAGAIEAHLAMISLRLNVVMKQMTAWGAILVVATIITGLYGMNFDHMPELHWYLGYPFAISMILVSTALLFRTFKRRDWL
jgi:magnesium transporter